MPVPPVAVGPVVVEAPPQVPTPTPANPLARLLPVVMLVAAIGMMAVYFTSGSPAMRHPMYAFFPVMMLTSVLGTLVYGARGNNRTADINEERKRYLRYVDTLDQTIATTAEAQRRSLQWCHPDPRTLWTLAGGRRMWERSPGDPDFCLVRVGIGAVALSTDLAAPDLSGVDEPDLVTATALRRLVHGRSVVADAPIAVSLPSFSLISVDGDAHVARAFIRSMICQLTVLHGPDHITICAVVGAETSADWDWLKWLPHHQRLRANPRHAVMILDGGEPADLGRDVSDHGITVLEVGASPVRRRGCPAHATAGQSRRRRGLRGGR